MKRAITRRFISLLLNGTRSFYKPLAEKCSSLLPPLPAARANPSTFPIIFLHLLQSLMDSLPDPSHRPRLTNWWWTAMWYVDHLLHVVFKYVFGFTVWNIFDLDHSRQGSSAHPQNLVEQEIRQIARRRSCTLHSAYKVPIGMLEQPKPVRRVVVYLHGMFNSNAMYSDWIWPAMKKGEEDCIHIALDLLGMGLNRASMKEAGPEGPPYTPQWNAHAVLCTVTRKLLEMDPSYGERILEMDLVGFSLGSIVCTGVASLLVEDEYRKNRQCAHCQQIHARFQLSKLTLFATPCFSSSFHALEFWRVHEQGIFSPLANCLQFPRITQVVSAITTRIMDAVPWDWVMSYLDASSTVGWTLIHYRDFLRHSYDSVISLLYFGIMHAQVPRLIEKIASKPEVSLTFIHGRQDPIASFTELERCVGHLKTAQFIIFDDEGHSFPTRKPKHTARLLDEVLFSSVDAHSVETICQ